MGRHKSQTEAEAIDSGEQLMLIDIDHPEAKALKRAYAAMCRAGEAKDAASDDFKLKREKLLEIGENIADDCKVVPDGNGVRTFRMGGLKVSIHPRGDLIKVKDVSDEPQREADEE